MQKGLFDSLIYKRQKANTGAAVRTKPNSKDYVTLCCWKAEFGGAGDETCVKNVKLFSTTTTFFPP